MGLCVEIREFLRIIFIYLLLLSEHMRTFTAMLEKDEDVYVARCPEVGTVSQGHTIEEALANLKKPLNCIWKSFQVV